MKPIKNYVLLVDSYRRPDRRRNTAGRYRVGAKTPEEAVRLLRAVIGFGSIRVHFEANDVSVGYKEVVQEVFDMSKPGAVFKHVEPHHANAPRESYKVREG